MRWLITLLLTLSGLTSATAQEEATSGLPEVTEGSLVYRSPRSGRFEFVPLEHTDVDIDVRGLVASATVSQRYANHADEPIEAVYVFPLPHDAAVYDLEVHIGERVIRSVIRERQEAKRTYEAAKANGQHAALLEQERPNIFTASLANLVPGDAIEVRVRYVEPLDWENGRLRLVFPMVVGPRFVPGGGEVPEAKRITPPVRPPDSRPGHDLSLVVHLDAGLPLAPVTSPSHAVSVVAQEGGRYEVRLAQETTLPNRDFVLEIPRAVNARTQTALFLSPSPAGEETQFMLVAYPPSVQKEEERPPMEMLFLIDISGSMAGTSIRQARSALLQGLERLRPGDRFNVVAFDDTFFGFAPAPLPATPANLDAGRSFVRRLDARGGTVMLPALEHLMGMAREPGYLRCIVVLTDGDLGNEEEVLSSVRRHLGEARLYTVAIGSAPNHFLATKMAEHGRGTFSHIADTAEVGERMGRLLDTIESPVLTDLALRFEGPAVEELYPSRPPDLFLGRPLVLYGRFKGAGAGTLHFEGTARHAPYRESLSFDTRSASFHPGITTLWARKRIEEELDLWRGSREDDERTRRRAAIVEDALHYKLVTQFTSLVAVEEQVVNADGRSTSVAVPTELPHGWQWDKVFGSAPATGTADAFLEVLGLALLALGVLLWTPALLGSRS